MSSPSDRDKGLAGLEHEIAGERAAALGRIGRKLEASLVALAAHAGPGRDDRVAEAAELLWFYIVQREVMGAYHHDDALAAYGVPAEVIRRMGPRVAKPSGR